MKPAPHCEQVAPVFLEYEEKLRAFIRKRIPDEDDGKDLLQQVLLRLYHHCEKLPDVRNMQGWLYQVTRNTLNDYFKEKARHISLNGQPAKPGPQEAGMLHAELSDDDRLQKEMVEYIRPLISLLPLKYSEPLIMSDLEGIPQQEIADRLDISLSGAKSRVQRAREKLREVILECSRLELDRQGRLISMEIKDSCGCMQGVKSRVQQAFNAAG